MTPWNKEIEDAITEVMNMAVGTAAVALSDMVSSEVLLSVPKVQRCSSNHIVSQLEESSDNPLVAIRESFDGSISGNAFLIFPEQGSLSLIANLLGLDDSTERISKVAREALVELGNIVLNSCIGVICNLLDHEVETQIPEFLQWGELDTDKLDETEGLFVQIVFTIKESNIEGALAFFMSPNAVKDLYAGINKLVMEST